MYSLIRGKPIEEIQFEYVDVTAGKYKNKKVCQNIFTFDTETTSDFLDADGKPFLFDYDNPQQARDAYKHSLCYLWQFGIDEDTRYIGRELYDFVELLRDLKKHLNKYAITICYVHNFAFDFNFLINVLHFDEVFARNARHPMCATCKDYQIEFKCSFILSGLKLETWAESLKMPVRKLKMNYREMRTPLTPLPADVIDYSLADLDVIYYGIKAYKEQYDGLHNIPLTHTGKMRKACEEVMQGQYKYCEKVTRLMPQTIDDFREQTRAFIGGTVLCNWLYKNRVIKKVKCYDIASSYPYVLIASKKYPMSIFFKCPKGYEQKYMHNDKYVYIIHFEVDNIESIYNCHFISKSKAMTIKDAVVDNGRVVSASHIELTLTSVDYEIFLKCYKHDRINIISFKFSKCGYLNNNFRRFIISLYKDKTTLKDVEGKEEEYQSKKALINAGYGDFVTKLFCDDVIFDYDNKSQVWDKKIMDEEDFNKKLSVLNKKKYKNYKAFVQGIFVTANARARIWDAVINGLDENIVYTDTDSLKVHNYDGDYFEKRNEEVMQIHKQIADDLEISIDDLSPVDIKGVKHPIGVWEREKDVEKFKSLGCKQYIVEYADGKKKLTCAGVSKLAVQLFDDVDDFCINRQLTEKELLNCKDDAGHTAEKLTPYYDVDYPQVIYPDGYVCNYKSGVCLMPTTFNLSITVNDLKLIYETVTAKMATILYKDV